MLSDAFDAGLEAGCADGVRDERRGGMSADRAERCQGDVGRRDSTLTDSITNIVKHVIHALSVLICDTAIVP